MRRITPSILASIAALLSMPSALAQAAGGWENIGPKVHNADAVEVAGVTGEVFFTIVDDGYWVRSADGGATWTNVPRDTDIRNLIPVPGQRALYAKGPYDSSLWFSPDSGASWEQIFLPALAPSGYLFSPAGPQPGVIYGVSSKISGGFVGQPINIESSTAIRSTDGGHTWSAIGPTLTDKVFYITAAPSDVTTAYAWAPSDGMYRTRDSGATWRSIWSQAERGTPLRTRVDSRDPLLVYVLVSGDNTLWVTEDGGDHWRAAASELPWSSYVSEVLPDPLDSRRAFGISGDGDVLETRDAGHTWTRRALGASLSRLTPRVSVKDGHRSILAADWNNGVVSLDLSKPHPIALGTDLWWNPAQSGWGLSIAQHYNYQMFAVWFTYDAQGKPTWRFIPGGTWTDSTTFTGTLYIATVPPRDFFASTFTAPTVTPVGTATLRFADANSADATFTVGDALIRQPIERMTFGPVDKMQIGAADLWFNANQSGWGISLHQQYSTVFATWFLYDDDGMPTWLFLPNATTFYGQISGDVYRSTGSAGTKYEARGVTVTRTGTATVNVPPSSPGAMSATIGSRQWSSPISRLPF